MRVRAAWALVLVCALWMATPVHAERVAAPETASIHAHLEARGARNVREILRTFMFEGESQVRELSFDHRGCVGLLALGRGDVRDVDLALHTRGGLLLAEDTQVEPYAYARVCVAPGVPLYVSAQLFAGRGELVVLAMDEAPRELGRLEDVVSLALEPGGVSEGPRMMGGAPEEAPFEAIMRQLENELSDLGYDGSGPVTPVLLRGASGMASLTLAPNQCQRVVVLVPFARGVAATLVAADGREWLARKPSSDRATLFVCTEGSTEPYELRVDSRVVRSVALVRSFVHPGVQVDEVRSMGEARALGGAEARTVARARGMTLGRLGEGWVDSSAPLSWPASLVAGRCYGLWALGDQGLASVDARLVDATGRVVARTEGPPHGASLYHCPAQSGDYRIVLRPRGDRGIVSLWLGTSGSPGE